MSSTVVEHVIYLLRQRDIKLRAPDGIEYNRMHFQLLNSSEITENGAPTQI